MDEYKYTDINGIKIAYRETGAGRSGRPVVLVHGFASFSYTWLSLVKLLPRNHRYVAIDMKGFGYSDKPKDGKYSAQDQSEILVEFINKLGLNNSIIIGHSFGGMVSLLTLISGKLKSPATGLVLVDPAAYFGHMPEFIEKLRIPIAGKLALELSPNRTLVDWVLKEVFYDHAKITEEMMQNYEDYLSQPDAKETLLTCASQFTSQNVKDAHENFDKVNVRTLVISGVDDNLIPVQESYNFQRDLPSMTLEVIPQCGHSPQEECPKETAKFISEYLANIR